MAAADPLRNRCYADYWKHLAENLAKNSANAAQNIGLAQVRQSEPLEIGNQYLEELGIKTCMLQDFANQFGSPGYEKLCPSIRPTYRLECYKSWLKTQEINFSALIPILADMATNIAKKDQDAGADKNLIGILMIDAKLIPFENMTTTRNVAFGKITATPALRKLAVDLHWKTDLEKNMQAQQAELQKDDKRLFRNTKNKLLPEMEGKASEMRSALDRQPSSKSGTQAWVKSMISYVEERIKRVKIREI